MIWNNVIFVIKLNLQIWQISIYQEIHKLFHKNQQFETKVSYSWLARQGKVMGELQPCQPFMTLRHLPTPVTRPASKFNYIILLFLILSLVYMSCTVGWAFRSKVPQSMLANKYANIIIKRYVLNCCLIYPPQIKHFVREKLKYIFLNSCFNQMCFQWNQRSNIIKTNRIWINLFKTIFQDKTGKTIPLFYWWDN